MVGGSHWFVFGALELLRSQLDGLNEPEINDEGHDEEGDDVGDEGTDVDPAWNPAREVRGAAQLADQVHDDCRKRFDDGGKCAAKDECDG